MRKKIIILSTTFLFVLSVLLSPSVAKADILVKKKKHTDAVTMMGQTQPAKDEEVETWLGKDKMRQEEGDGKVYILRFDLNKAYYIDYTKNTYSEIDLPIDLEKALGPQAQQMMQMMQASSTFTDTGEKQKIKNWNCKKYLAEINISMMGMSMPIKMEIWASKDLGVDTNMYKKFYKETLALNPMTKELVEDFQKMEGFPVLTNVSMSMMGTEMKYHEEVISVEKKDAPKGTYEVPEGFTKAAFNPLDMRR
ncbi:MAG: DUF4412 domain-containing protein [Candidatus Aminicenantes bacterium]|nr:MAG: DUF4412 domain-containing protein [Candidatus Aminicenantes bacterium]